MWTRWADPGCADAIVAFEAIEALRAWQYLKEGGTVIVNDETIVLVSVVIGAFKMLDDVEARLDAWEQRRSMLASSHVQQGGSESTNVVLVGALSTMLPLDEEAWESAIRRCVPPRRLRRTSKPSVAAVLS
jgi:indolepyruvate ferredoxin oxidoreductase beta subunit